MALIIADRVQETTLTVGTSDYALVGAKTGFQSFGAVMANGDTTYYAVTDGIDWEVGIGTYSTTGPTMVRTTILSSSNAGSAVSWAAGTKDIFLSYAAEKSVYLDASGALLVADKIVHTGDTDTAIRFPAANTMSVETGGVERFKVEDTTITTTVPVALPANPTLALQAATKQYVDALIASGIHFHAPVRVESPINLNATYNNGASGVGATLTNAGTQVALVIDGVTVATNDRVLIYTQADQTQNGIYVVTDTGSGSTNWVLTRSSDADTYVINNANGLSEGSTVFVQQGATGAGETYTCNTSGVITFGTTAIVFVQISTAQIYSAGSGLTLTGTVFAHADTSSQASVDNTGATFIQDVDVDTFGHVTSLTSTTITPSLIGAPSTTGVGASGSWGISVTGTSANVTGTVVVANGGTGATDAATARTNLGLAIGTNVQAYNANLNAISGLAVTDNNFIVGNGTTWVAENGATARTSLGLGSLATASTINNDNWSGTDLSVANGGTGASDAATARTNLNVPTRTGGDASGTWGINITGGSATATNLSTDRNNWSTNGTISAVVGQLAWKNYGNGHTIFDASNSTSPNGGGVNNTNAQIAWTGTYPTLMGWNGANTYGVRVDSARVADSCAALTTASGSAPSYSARAWVKFNGANGGIYGSQNVSSVTYNGTGQSTVNFSTAMVDTNYSAVCSGHSAGFGRQANAFPLFNGFAAGSCVIWYGNTINAAAENLTHVNVAFFR